MASSLKVNRVVPSTGTNIGLGTASGEIRLASTSKLTFDGDTDTYIWHPSANQLAITRTGASFPIIRFGSGGGGNTITMGNTTSNLVTNSEILAVRGYSTFKSTNNNYAAIYTHNEGNTSGTYNAHLLWNAGGANRGGIGYMPNNGEVIINNQNALIFATGATQFGGTQRINIISTGEVLIGSRTAKPNDINKLVVTGTSPADSYDSQIYLEGSETTGAVDTGGALAFGGHDNTTFRNWANIYGMKENAIGGNTASYMAFHTRPAGGNPTERLRIKSNGDIEATGSIKTNNLPGRNLLINGAMRINQKESTTHNSDGYQVADMWWWGKYSTDQLVTTQANVTNDHPDEFDHSYKLSVATAETTLDNNEYGILRTRIEGQNLQHLKTGTSSAKELTLSFWAKTASANSGDTYSVCIVMGDISGNDRIQYRTFAPTSTWQKFTMSFVGQENNQIRNDNDYGLTLHYVLAAGSSKVTSANTTWSLNTNVKGVTGQSNFFDNTSNEFYVTGVQLEVGSIATEFEHKFYGEELTRCQRYLFRLGGGDTEVATTLAMAIQSHSTTAKAHIQFPVTMRSKSINYTISDLTLDDDVASYGAGRVNSISSDQSGTTSSTLIFNTDSLTSVRATRVVVDTAGGYIQGECEL